MVSFNNNITPIVLLLCGTSPANEATLSSWQLRFANVCKYRLLQCNLYHPCSATVRALTHSAGFNSPVELFLSSPSLLSFYSLLFFFPPYFSSCSQRSATQMLKHCTVNSGELRIPYPVPVCVMGNLWFVFAISCNIKPLNFTNHNFSVTQTRTGYGIRSSPEFTVCTRIGGTWPPEVATTSSSEQALEVQVGWFWKATLFCSANMVFVLCHPSLSFGASPNFGK